MNLTIIGTGPWAEVYRELYGQPETPKYEQPDCVAVVNKTHLHESEAIRYLRWAVPVLIEKPIALTTAGAQDIVGTAKRNGTYVAAAHVLKFDRRIDALAESIERRTNDTWQIIWTDPANGRYDPRVLIEVDVLPHIATILDTLMPGCQPFCDGVSYGGIGREIRLRVGNVTVDVTMARDYAQRQRLVRAGGHELDFSALPADHNPLRNLIHQFLSDVEHGTRDPRLDAGLGVRACRLTDDVLDKIERYREPQAYVGP